MNMQINKVYFKKSDNVNNEYLYEIQFTDDVVVLVQFVIGRLFDVVDVRVVYNRWVYHEGLKEWKYVFVSLLSYSLVFFLRAVLLFHKVIF